MSTDPIEIIEPEENPTPDRSRVARRGVFAVAAGGVAAAAAAFGRGSRPESVAGSSSNAAAPTARPAPAVAPLPRQAAPSEGDLAIGAVAASLEVLAVNTYGAALDAAGSGALGEVPPAVAEFVTVAMAQHQAALDAWNGVLTAAGQPEVTAPPPALETAVNDQFAMVTDAGGAAQLALMLEQIAAATYLDAIGKLESPDAITLAGSIQPIDRQHISVLLFALGMYPVPETFANADMAFSGEPGSVPPMAPMMPATR